MIELYKEWGCIRYMQWQKIIGSPLAKWEDRTTPAMASWFGANINRPAYIGAASSSGNDYIGPLVRSGNPSAWTQGMQIQMKWTKNPTYKSISGLTNSNPCQITCTNHGYSDGDVIFFEPGMSSMPLTMTPTWSARTRYAKGAVITANGGVWKSLVSDNFGNDPVIDSGTNWLGLHHNALDECIGYVLAFYTVANATTNTFTIDADSTNWARYAGGGKVAKQIRCGSGALPMKRVVARDGGVLYQGDLTSGLLTLTYDAALDALLASIDEPDGFPIEVLVALANKLNVNPWFCVPHMADDDYVRKFATYVRDNLRSNLVAYFEFSNEIWNGAVGYWETGYAVAQARIKWGNTLPSFPVSRYVFYRDSWYGWRFYSVMSIISDVYSGQMSRCRRVMAEWTQNFARNGITQRDRHCARGTGVAAYPVSLADCLAIAPYIEADRNFGATTQFVWNYCYGAPEQKETALAWLDRMMRGDPVAAVTNGPYPAGSRRITVSSTAYINQQGSFQFELDDGTRHAANVTITGSTLLLNVPIPPGRYLLNGANVRTANNFTLDYCNKLLFPAWAALAADPAGDGSVPRKDLICYEGGPGLIPNANPLTEASRNGKPLTTADVTRFFIAYYESPYMARIIKDYLEEFTRNGGTYPSQFPLVGLWGASGLFGLMQPNEFGARWTSFAELQAFNASRIAP